MPADGRGDSGFGGMGAVAPPSEFAQVEALWQALRPPGGGLPPRAAVQPQGMARLLDRLMLLERLAPGVARIRLAGSRLADLMGMDLRGMPFTALMLPADRNAAAAAVDRVFAGPAIVTADFEGERGFGRPALAARLLLLPLTGPQGAPDRALGVMVLDGAPGRAPRRFALARATERPVPGLAPAPAAMPAAAGMAEAPAPWRPAAPPSASAPPAAPPPGRPTRTPWLRVVTPGD